MKKIHLFFYIVVIILCWLANRFPLQGDHVDWDRRTQHQHPLTTSRPVCPVVPIATTSPVVFLNRKATGMVRHGKMETEAERGPHYTTPHWKEWSLTGRGEIIAIADSGVDVYSCFFHDVAQPVSYYPSVNEKHRKIISYQPCNAPNVPSDAYDLSNGHGTHVAGTAAGVVEGSETDVRDFSAYNGVAPGAKLFVQDIGCQGHSDLQIPPRVSDIFDAAYHTGARISLNSWGLPPQFGYSKIETLIDDYAYRHDDFLVLFASGNEGRQEGKLFAPAGAKNVLTVGSHDNLPDEVLHVSPSSSFGPTADGRQKPEVLGPGGIGVASARAFRQNTQYQCGITTKHGTSMANGAVAGAAALMRQYLREKRHHVNPSAALLKAVLLHSAVTVSSMGDPRRSGFGSVNLSSILTEGGNVVFQDRIAIRHHELVSYCLRLSRPTPINSSLLREVKVTLVWTDVAAPLERETTHKSLVHDLDLVVVDEKGNLYYPLSFDVNQTASSPYDRVNNVERVHLSVEGRDDHLYRIYVFGYSVTAAPSQNFSLVVSAPGLEEMVKSEDCLVEHSTTVHCPSTNCSLRGTCDPPTGQCRCSKGFIGVDCGRCDNEVWCHGNGECVTGTKGSVSCHCHGTGHFSDASCGVCEEGWYGPHCDSRCECLHGGLCNASTGVCACTKDRTIGQSGCYSGDRCESCCFGFGGPLCQEKSYWCGKEGDGTPVVIADLPPSDTGLIQINGDPTYPYSALCVWEVAAPEGYVVKLNYEWIDLESPYDTLQLYEPSNDGKWRLRRSDTGSQPRQRVYLSPGRKVRLEFTSDWEGVRKGFEIRYRFVMDPKQHQTNTEGGETTGRPNPPKESKPPKDKHRTQAFFILLLLVGGLVLMALACRTKYCRRRGFLRWRRGVPVDAVDVSLETAMGNGESEKEIVVKTE